MIKSTVYTVAAALVLASTLVLASERFPDYYPNNGFQRVGTLDAVQLDRQTVVINDIAYSLASNIVVHSQSLFSIPSTSLRVGAKVGYKMAKGGQFITEIWLLPRDYKNPRQRR